MHLGRAVVAAVATIAARQQASQLLPSDYCKPECPSCKNEVTDPFDTATLCLPNSTYIVNCGSCQTCVWTYAVENPDFPGMPTIEKAVQILLDLCLNTTAEDEIVALQSQVSRISNLAISLTAGHVPTTTYSEFTRTTTGSSSTWTVTEVANPSWTTILATATWASAYYSEQAAVSSASAAAARYNQSSHANASTITAAPIASTSTPPSTSSDPLNKSWVVGPVIGSVLGVATVFVVIYFTRRKQKLDTLAIQTAKDIKEEEDDSSDSTQGKAQLHSESVKMGELANNEVYELPSPEPVGSELNSPRHGTMEPIEDWPLPLSPLPLLFAMTELRDERTGSNDSPKHETYYNP